MVLKGQRLPANLPEGLPSSLIVRNKIAPLPVTLFVNFSQESSPFIIDMFPIQSDQLTFLFSVDFPFYRGDGGLNKGELSPRSLSSLGNWVVTGRGWRWRGAGQSQLDDNADNW
jgi:hypothetical protein